MNRLIQKRKNGGTEAMVSSKCIKNLNEVRGVFTVPGGGFISVCNRNRVSHVDTAYGWHRRDIAGSGFAHNGRDDGEGLSASFNGPMCVIKDADDNILVADTSNHCLRKIDKKGDVSTFSGSGSAIYNNPIYDSPRSMVLMRDRCIAVVDTGNNCVWMLNEDGSSYKRVGGPDSGYVDGMHDEVRFNEPHGIILLRDNTLLVSDTGNNVLRRIYPNGRTITWAGKKSVTGGFRDGRRPVARFDRPEGMAITWDGVILVADRNNNRVRQIDGDEVSTLAGTGEYSQGRQAECEAGLASFRGPIAVGIDHEGTVLVCEESSRDDEIRIITGTGYAPAFHHQKHHMVEMVDHAAMEIVNYMSDMTNQEIGNRFEAACQNALINSNLSYEAAESGRQLMKDETFSDLIVEIEGHRFNLHACVMANASEYFSATLANPHFCTHKRQGKYFLTFDAVEYKDVVKRAAFVMVVDFIYSGRFVECEVNTLSMTRWTDEDGRFMDLECYILKLADFFQMDSMLAAYTTLFYKRLTPKSVIDKLVIVGKIPGLKSARQAAIDYIVENIDDVKEQDPRGWENISKLRRDVLVDIIEALTTTDQKEASYMQRFGFFHGGADPGLKTGDYLGDMPSTPDYAPTSPAY